MTNTTGDTTMNTKTNTTATNRRARARVARAMAERAKSERGAVGTGGAIGLAVIGFIVVVSQSHGFKCGLDDACNGFDSDEIAAYAAENGSDAEWAQS